MKKLFQSDLVYPSDENGIYIELERKVTSIDEGRINLQIENETYYGYSDVYENKPEYMPKLGYMARIRIYCCGGGHYPDNKIMGWHKI